MKIKKIPASGNSCNFCSRGKLSSSGYSLNYPYNDVYEVSGTGIIVQFCPQCLIQLGAIVTDEMIIEEIK
tara:strand:- start:732 stop:941 length:210 start_codon:yes stop_codon:yes gene_type:complete